MNPGGRRISQVHDPLPSTSVRENSSDILLLEGLRRLWVDFAVPYTQG